MGLPEVPEARRFYRAGRHRFDDARFLERGGRTTGAIYLAGYGVECLLKALILSSASDGRRASVLAGFRGSRAHDYDWLRKRYFENGGAPFPAQVAEAFSLVLTWSTDWRYVSRTASADEAADFLDAAERIITWADGRL